MTSGTLDDLQYAFCFGDGLIRFSPILPSGGYPLCHGTEADMVIVRRLAHKDGKNYWVPGDIDSTDREDHFEHFAELCCERAETAIPFRRNNRSRDRVREYQSYDEWLREALDCPKCG